MIRKMIGTKRQTSRKHFGLPSLVCLLLVILATLCAISCEKNILSHEERVKEKKFLMSTIVEITAIGTEDDCHRAIDLAFDEIRRIDDLMDFYNDDSEIAKINNAAGKSAVKVSNDTFVVINESLRIARLTSGALDITVAPLLELWEIGNGSGRIPSGEEISDKLSLVDYKKALIDKDNLTVKLDSPGMQINVSGIAKGYAVDRAIQVLKEAGIEKALVNAGGDIYALGKSHKKRAWRIGIQHPRRSRGNLLGALEMEDKAVATSGDYENFFEKDGKRYCHIMNPKTGIPVQGIMSVTIVAKNTTEADALATAIFPLGAENGMRLIESLEGIDGIIVTGEDEDDMGIMLSSGIKDSVQLWQP